MSQPISYPATRPRAGACTSLRLSTIDPITRREIDDVTGHPFVIDGDLTIYFESETTRRTFLNIPTDHLFRLIDNPVDEGYDEG